MCAKGVRSRAVGMTDKLTAWVAESDHGQQLARSVILLDERLVTLLACFDAPLAY